MPESQPSELAGCALPNRALLDAYPRKHLPSMSDRSIGTTPMAEDDH